MSRVRQSLDGKWQFQFQRGVPSQPDDTLPWRDIDVPAPWQAQFDDLREAAGAGWYRRSVDIPAGWQGQSVILHIGAAYHITTVWVNGQHIADHRDGYLPLICDISAAAQPGRTNTILIRVVSPSDDESLYPGMTFSPMPHGKQSWYGQLGGIWQSAWLECRHPVHMAHLQLQPDLNTGQVTCGLTLNQPVNNQYRLQVEVADAAFTEMLPIHQQNTNFSVTIDQPHPWSPDDPHLYQVHLKLCRTDGSVIDTLQKTFGFRTLETREGTLYLNGVPFYMRAALDQDYYPGTISTPPSVEFIEDQMHKAKAMGLNCLRFHIKLADPRYYEAADRIGILLWVDYPNASRLTSVTQEHIRRSLAAMLQRDHHHPCIGIWTIVNEDWGTDLVGNAAHRAWLQATYHWLKKEDPTRLVVDNSPCEPNFHIETDLNDYHYYSAIPDNAARWDQFVTDFAAGTFPSYSPHGDAIQTGDEPRIVSEFGNWGLPDVDGLHNDDGSEPWWFETGDEWPEGIVYPHGVKKRFMRWNLNRWFGAWERFVEQVQWQQYQALSYEIDSIRRQSSLAGYVITEFTDVHWEANGLLDMKRHPKAFFDAMPAISGETTLIPDVPHPAVWAGATITISINVSHHGRVAIEGARLVLTHEDKSLVNMPLPKITFNQPIQQSITLEIPSTDQIQDADYHLTLETPGGVVITQRDLRLHIYPQLAPEVTVWTPSERLGTLLESLGYATISDRQASDLIIADELTPALGQHIQQGSRLLLLAEHAGAIPAKNQDPLVIEPRFPYARVVQRQHTAWEGNWASTFAWVAIQGLGKSALLLDRRFQHVIPRHIITGFTQRDFQSRVFAGLFAGWVHKPVVLAGVRHYGDGLALLSTFQLSQQDNIDDPVSHHLLYQLIKQLLH